MCIFIVLEIVHLLQILPSEPCYVSCDFISVMQVIRAFE